MYNKKILKEQNVEPRPTGVGIAAKRNWDRRYAATHFPDGTPKPEGSVEPRPRLGLPGRRWDREYGTTHNPDGTPIGTTPAQTQTPEPSQAPTPEEPFTAPRTPPEMPSSDGSPEADPEQDSLSSITSNLRAGSRGEGVRALQQRLGINADGVFGPETAQAVRAFQQENNLQVDGEVGTQTLAALRGRDPQEVGVITPAPTSSPRPTERPRTPEPRREAPMGDSKQNFNDPLIERLVYLSGIKNKQMLNEDTMSISLNGSAEDIASLIALMKNAGLQNSGAVSYHSDDEDCGCSSCQASKNTPDHSSMDDLSDIAFLAGSKSSPCDNENEVDEWDNQSDEEYKDDDYMINTLSGGINRQKNMYKAAQPGDNAMAVESVKERLYKALAEAKKKSKPDYLDFDGDGDKKEPMKKALKDKKKKSKKK